MVYFPLRILFLSTPVGPLGSGLGGGVELTLVNLCQELISRGHQLTVLAPEGSSLAGGAIHQVPGQWQPTAHTQARQVPVTIPENAVLANMWTLGRQLQADYDLLVNLAYDWLPFYLTPFFEKPIAHFISMGSLSSALDHIVGQTAHQFPGTLGVYTRAQAETFPCPDQLRCLGSAVDLQRYQYCDRPGEAFAWLGRISPEKGLEDAVAAAHQSHIPLKIMGKIEDERYWQQILQRYPDAPLEYLGFLTTTDLQAQLRQCRALIMTPRWIEAFGNVAIEALACGVPVIAYARGGPGEIVRPGETGWLVEPDSVTGLMQAIAAIDQIDRAACRAQAEAEYSLEALGDRFEQWFVDILSHTA